MWDDILLSVNKVTKLDIKKITNLNYMKKFLVPKSLKELKINLKEF